jgi:DNA polymerase-1
VIDTETTSLDPLQADLVGISLCLDSKEAWYIPVGHKNSDADICPGQLDTTLVLAALQPLFTDQNLPKIGHNLKYDYRVLARYGIYLRGPLLDTILASYLLDPSRRSHKLDDLSILHLNMEILHLNMELTSFSQVTQKDKRPDAFAYVDLEAARDYSCEDVIASRLLWELFYPQLKELELWELFNDLETALIPILAAMETNGIKVTPAVLKTLSKEFGEELDSLQKIIYALADEEFNINSPKQLATILFEKLNLPHGRKTKTGYSTDVKVLEKLSAYHDLPATILAHRSLSKLKSTYVDKLAIQINPQTGRIHTSFNQTVTATGRLSSSNPNLQNIPIRSEEGLRIRKAFVADTGRIFLAADYSQIDLRVLAHYSQDEALLQAFQAGKDVHSMTAAEIFRVNSNFITPQMRRVAKTINFGIVYGMSAFGLSSQLNLSRKEAQTFIDRYFILYAGVKDFMRRIVDQAKEDGYVTTLLHRRRILPDINSSNRTKREFAERTAINTPIQGTAADIIKLATLQVDKRIRDAGLQAKLLLQIHDELVFEVPEQELEDTTPLVKEAMESVMTLDVPLLVNISAGHDLASVK